MTLIMFGLLFLFLFLNIPIFISVGLPTVLVSLMSGESLRVFAHTMFTSLNSFTFMAIPFFILAGKLMEHGGISQKIIDFANSLVGHYRGGLAYVMVLGCMIFAAVSGSALGTAVAIGGVMLPAMIQQGYSRTFSAALLASAGLIGLIIPPSVPMVVYGALADASISKLFLAGIIPGVIMGLSLMGWTYYVCRKYNYGIPQERKTLKEVWNSFRSAVWAILMPVIILGGIYGGFFTPTEASVIAVVYGFLVGIFVYRLITVQVIKKILLSTVITTSVLCIIISASTYFGMWLTRNQIPQAISAAFLEGQLPPFLTMILIIIFLLILGTFMDAAAAQIITTPILVPITTSVGYDSVHFGLIMISTLAVGLLTPPLGVCLALSAQMAKTSFESVIRPAIPLVIILILDIILITLFPQLSIGLANFILD